MCFKKKYFGFTLAEVLITLGIIGIVAAITMPVLIQSHKKTVYVTQLEKTISTLEQGFKLAIAEDGVEFLNDTNLWKSANGCNGFIANSSCNEFYKNFQKYFNVNYEKNATYRLFSHLNQTNTTTYGNTMDINLPSGSQIHFENLNQTPNSGNYAPHSNLANIVVDVNGIKNPNRMGRDVFLLGVTEYGQVIPYGSQAAINAYCTRVTAGVASSLQGCINSLSGNYNWDTQTNNYNCLSNGNGYFCAARIMAEAWKMNY